MTLVLQNGYRTFTSIREAIYLLNYRIGLGAAACTCLGKESPALRA